MKFSCLVLLCFMNTLVLAKDCEDDGSGIQRCYPTNYLGFTVNESVLIVKSKEFTVVPQKDKIISIDTEKREFFTIKNATVKINDIMKTSGCLNVNQEQLCVGKANIIGLNQITKAILVEDKDRRLYYLYETEKTK